MNAPLRLARALYNRVDLKAARGPIGIALIGVGGWGANNAANIMRSRRFTVTGALDVDRACARNFAGRYRTGCYENLEQLLADPSVHAVCITVPNHLHLDLIKAAASAGKHVFVEKPLASLADECVEAGRHCDENQVILQVGHQMRFEPVFRELKHIVDSERFGTLLFAQGVYTLERRRRDDWRSARALCPGGAMEQLGIHLLDVLVHLAGPPVSVRGVVRPRQNEDDSRDWRRVDMEFANGAGATVSTSFSSPSHLGLELFFDGGRAFTDGVRLWTEGRSGGVRKSRPRGAAGGIVQFARFADAIDGGAKPATGAAEARILMNIIQSVHGDGARV